MFLPSAVIICIKQISDLFEYHVEVFTGDQAKAGTDANVFLCIHGNKGDTGLRRLMASKTNSNKFEQGNVRNKIMLNISCASQY